MRPSFGAPHGEHQVSFQSAGAAFPRGYSMPLPAREGRFLPLLLTLLASYRGRALLLGSERRLGLPMHLGDVLEACVLGQEHDFHGSDRPVTLLADDHFRDVVFVWRQVIFVDLLTIQKEDQVAVLLKG